MFDAKKEIADAVDRTYQVASNLKRGEILTHDCIANILDVQPHEGSWDHIVRKVRRRLQREKGIVCRPVLNVGYRLVSAPEQVRLGEERTRRGLRQVRRGRGEVEATPNSELSLNERKLKSLEVEGLKASEKELRRKLREQSDRFRTRDSMPIRKEFLVGT